MMAQNAYTESAYGIQSVVLFVINRVFRQKHMLFKNDIVVRIFSI